MENFPLKSAHPIEVSPSDMKVMAGPFDVPIYIEVEDGKIVAFHLRRDRKYSLKQMSGGACRLWSDAVETAIKKDT
jgi:hypothetical protein